MVTWAVGAGWGSPIWVAPLKKETVAPVARRVSGVPELTLALTVTAWPATDGLAGVVVTVVVVGMVGLGGSGSVPVRAKKKSFPLEPANRSFSCVNASPQSLPVPLAVKLGTVKVVSARATERLVAV